MGSRAGNRPSPRSPRAAQGAAEGETEEMYAAPWVAMPTRRRPCRLQSPSAQQRGGGEERRGASARPVPGGPRAPPARRPGRSSWRAGGTIESPRHRPLTARAPARAAPTMHRTMARPPPLPGPERACRPPARGPERGECRQGPRGTVGSGAGGVSLCPRARHPARSPIPPTGGPLCVSPRPDRPQGDENSPRTQYLSLWDPKKPHWSPAFQDLETQPGGSPSPDPQAPWRPR